MAILKIILVMSLLATVMLILLGIGQLSSGALHHQDAEDLDNLRREIEEEEEVIGRGSIFRALVNSQGRRMRNVGKKILSKKF